MATYYSTEYTNLNSNLRNSPNTGGGVFYQKGTFTGQALSSSDTVIIMPMPQGAKILPQSMIIVSDLESSATVNVGYGAHTNASSGATVAADADAFCSAIAADSARTQNFLTEATTHDDGFTFTGTGDITLALGAGTSVSADTFDLHILYTVGGE
tara:strand:+ start:818 stop:1282 length:465 start_codon:yes stop_codon:yes gene_type:complete